MIDKAAINAIENEEIKRAYTKMATSLENLNDETLDFVDAFYNIDETGYIMYYLYIKFNKSYYSVSDVEINGHFYKDVSSMKTADHPVMRALDDTEVNYVPMYEEMIRMESGSADAELYKAALNGDNPAVRIYERS